MNRVTLHTGDALAVLRTMAALRIRNRMGMMAEVEVKEAENAT